MDSTVQCTVRLAFKRDGEMAALKRCTPLHFTDGMGGAVAGRPIAIRFVDSRTIDRTKSQQ
jgi:hypothetical protein